MNPSSANRVDDLYETVRLLHSLKKEGIEDWRVGVALNRLREVSAVQDNRDCEAIIRPITSRREPWRTA